MSSKDASTSSSQHDVICHYDLLQVPRNADAALIKQQYRKLALKHHPDKNLDNPEEAQVQFRLVQQAYECLSDPAERKWYDEHRDAILQGWSANGNNGGGGYDGDDGSMSLVVNVIPYLHAGCYNGYTDQEGDFFAVYRQVFQLILQNEQQGWINQGNLDDLPWLPKRKRRGRGGGGGSDAAPIVDFGRSDTEWNQVSAFYQTWHCFSSCWNFAWADEYQSQDGDERRLRRAMDDHNQRRRKWAKREYNDNIMALIQFCQRRDPRVKAHERQVQQEKLQRQQQQEQELFRKRQETQQAREAWKVKAAEELVQLEEEDRLAGRVRLADLDDDYDYSGGNKKRGKKKKKGKKNKNQQLSSDDEDDVKDNFEETNIVLEPNSEDEGNGLPQPDANGEAQRNQVEPLTTPASSGAQANATNDTATEPFPVDTTVVDANPEGYCESETVLDSEDEDDDDSIEHVWRCECCRKDFKSEGQLENHAKSKKHKEAFKKYQAKLKKSEEALMNELLDELETE